MSYQDEKMSSGTSVKDVPVNASVATLSELDEYHGLCETMTDERLKRLTRKIE